MSFKITPKNKNFEGLTLKVHGKDKKLGSEMILDSIPAEIKNKLETYKKNGFISIEEIKNDYKSSYVNLEQSEEKQSEDNTYSKKKVDKEGK